MDKSKTTSSAIRKMVIGCIVAEYGMIQLKDNTKQELKMRVNGVLNACKRVQDWFITHPSATEEHKEIFKKEFLSDRILLLSELLETTWGIDDDGIEEIIKAVKVNLSPANENY